MKFIAVLVFAYLVVTNHHARAQRFTDLYVFGDSLTDMGNTRAVTSGSQPPAPPYLTGRWSNGPVWVEHVAIGLGLPVPKASLDGGRNYAWSGAQTGGGNSTVNGVPNIGPQIEAFRESGNEVKGTDLFALWAGHNDPGYISTASSVANLSGHLTMLHGQGARNFLLGNLGLFGAEAMNPLIIEMIAGLRLTLTDVEIFLFDFEGLLGEVKATPSEFGFANVEDVACLACDRPSRTLVGDPDEYLYWDQYLHPSGAFHQIIGERAFAVLLPEHPEPWGDFNSDGVLDVSDYQILISNMHLQSTKIFDGDMDFDGVVSLDDFALFRREYERHTPAVIAAVPEPDCHWMVLVGACATAIRFRVDVQKLGSGKRSIGDLPARGCGHTPSTFSGISY